jgi:hypothetical protein
MMMYEFSDGDWNQAVEKIRPIIVQTTKNPEDDSGFLIL